MRKYKFRKHQTFNESIQLKNSTFTNLHFNLNMAKQQCTNVAVPVRNKNVSSLVLISNSGILHYKIVEGAINSLLFVEFFEEFKY